MGSMLPAGPSVGFTLTGVLFVLPLLFQRQFGYGPPATGCAFLPMTLPTAVNPVLLTGRVVARFGPRGPILAGLCLPAGAGLVMGVAVWTGAGYPLLAAGLLAAGFGVSLALPTGTPGQQPHFCRPPRSALPPPSSGPGPGRSERAGGLAASGERDARYAIVTVWGACGRPSGVRKRGAGRTATRRAGPDYLSGVLT